jgi:molybdopterin-guanine dinucleotide biosynthesis protein A
MSASAVVLAGGRSRRMGRDKASLPFGDETLLQRVVRLVAPRVAEVVVVGHGAATLPATVRVVADQVEGEGPLAGLVTGLDAIASPRAVLVACDMPLLVAPVISRLLSLHFDADACVPRINGVPVPTCAVYAARVAPIARQRLASGDRSMRGLLGELAVRWVEGEELRDVDPELLSFRDCDTPEDYAAALALLRAHGS